MTKYSYIVSLKKSDEYFQILILFLREKMFTTIISITLSVVSACCWLPNLAIVLIYILKMIIPIFSSTFFKNKFPKIGTELMYFCQ